MLSSWRARLRLPSFSCALASRTDRKSTRLNSSHSQISYAVFCLKKKAELHGALLADDHNPQDGESDHLSHKLGSTDSGTDRCHAERRRRVVPQAHQVSGWEPHPA